MTTQEPRAQGDWARLAHEVVTRRQWLQLSQSGLARRGGPSHETVRLVERQGRESFRDLTLSQLDRALQWKSGIASQIVYGTPPSDHRKWEADLSVEELAHQADAVRAARTPKGMSPLPMSLDNVSDLELAGELVSRLTRGRGTAENRGLLAELMSLLTRLSDEEGEPARTA